MVVQSMSRLDIESSSIHDLRTPLRYPGGKSALSGFVAKLITECGLRGADYVEPFAGGAGLALRLLEAGVVSTITINDYDRHVFSFWQSAVHNSRRFLERFDSTEITIEEWRNQKEILRSSSDLLEIGFAFFFINRTSRSGVINGGAIGGLSQQGRYKIDARFNRAALRKKLEYLATNKACIKVSNLDGIDLVRKRASSKDAFLFIDPPYIQKGKSLYLNAMSGIHHDELAKVLCDNREGNWLLTYDDVPFVKERYSDLLCGSYQLDYSANTRRRADELMVASNPVHEAIEKVLSSRVERLP